MMLSNLVAFLINFRIIQELSNFKNVNWIIWKFFNDFLCIMLIIYRNIGFESLWNNMGNKKLIFNLIVLILARILWNYIEFYLNVIKLKEVQDAEA